MIQLRHWQYLLLALLGVPAVVAAQQFNNIYMYETPYQNSVHTDGIQISNGDIAEAGTIERPSTGQNVVELGAVDLNGTMVPPVTYFFDPDEANLEAVDMVESYEEDQVIEVANYLEEGGLNRIQVFKADPYGGGYSWAVRLGQNWDTHLHGAAIISDKGRYYFVLGYTRTEEFDMIPYLAKLDDNGTVIWEFLYFPSAEGSFESIDLLFDEESSNVIIAANRYIPYPDRFGIVALEVSGINGALVAASYIPSLDGTVNFEVRDIDFTSEQEYAFVGRIHNKSNTGYMIRYQSGLVPSPIFSIIYALEEGIFMTGVKPYYGACGGTVLSFEWGNAAGFVWPGMLQANSMGIPIPGQSLSYYIENTTYIASRGLIELNDYQDFAIKGAVEFEYPSLSLIADFTPFVPSAGSPICSEERPVEYYSSEEPEPIEFNEEQIETWEEVEMEYEEINGVILDCENNSIGNFRLAPPANTEGSTETNFSIYPNPTKGMFTLEVDKEQVGKYHSVEVYNALGEVVKKLKVNKVVESIDLSGTAPGIYFLRMKGSEGLVTEPVSIMIK